MVNQVSLDAAKVLTVPYRVRSTAKNGLYSWAVQRDIPALLIERGGQGLWSEQEVDACCEDVRSLLRHLEIMPGGNPPRDQLEITETFYAEAESEGFWYPAVGLDQRVRRGELLGHLEALSGCRLQEVRGHCPLLHNRLGRPGGRSADRIWPSVRNSGGWPGPPRQRACC